MLKFKYLSLVALAAMLLAACAGTARPTATTAPTDAPTAVARATVAPTEPPAAATDTPVAATDEPAPTAVKPTEPPEEPSLPFLEIRPDDWVRGPDDAAVTLIEFGDFQ